MLAPIPLYTWDHMLPLACPAPICLPGLFAMSSNLSLWANQVRSLAGSVQGPVVLIDSICHCDGMDSWTLEASCRHRPISFANPVLPSQHWAWYDTWHKVCTQLTAAASLGICGYQCWLTLVLGLMSLQPCNHAHSSTTEEWAEEHSEVA